MSKQVSEQVAVLVTTQHKGVFFGFAEKRDMENKALIRLFRARNCIYWAASVGGFLGLASTGPDVDCRIGKEASEIILHDITSCAVCSPEAVKAWTSR